MFTLAVTCCHGTRAKTVNQAVRLDGLRLLLIEDNPLTQRITIEMLKTSGAQIVAVGNAAQALETLQNSEPFAAALVDFDLPDIDGITLARQLAQQYPSLVLIGFSAHVIDETLRQRTSSLFRGIIPKPVPREVLGQLLAHYLQLQVNNDQSLDVSQLNEDAQLMGTEKIHEWLVLFTQHALPLLDEIDIARASQDSEKIKRAAHQLKAVARVWECISPASYAHNWSSSHYLPPSTRRNYTQCCRSGSMVA